MEIVIASNNKHKVEEFQAMLENFFVLPMGDVGCNLEVEENGKSFYENAKIKAEAVSSFLKGRNYIVLSDDSGLCVDALGGRPGIYSARYSGEHGNDRENRKKLLDDLKNCSNRSAHFQCDLVAIFPDGKEIHACGKAHGEILEKELGENGFGYDSLFFSKELGKTFAQATEQEKNSVSHRAKAVQNLLQILKEVPKFDAIRQKS